MRAVIAILGVIGIFPAGMSAQPPNDPNRPKVEVSAANGVTIASTDENYSLTIKTRMAGGIGLDFEVGM